MRFLIIPTALGDTKPDPNAPFDEAYFDACMKFNEAMHVAGVLVASEGLQPPVTGAHVVVRGGKRKPMDGPFAESKELVAGFWLLEVKSKEEALQWAMRAPINPAQDEVVEVRALTGAADLPPELVEKIRRAAPKWSAAFEHKR